MAEAIAREVVSELRGKIPPRRENISLGPLSVDLPARAAFVRDVRLTLAPREFSLLAALARNPGIVMSREQLLRLAWESTSPTRRRSVDTHVCRLRAKLQASCGKSLPRVEIVLAPKAGYKLELTQ